MLESIPVPQEQIEHLQRLVDQSRNMVFFGGAGVSTDRVHKSRLKNRIKSRLALLRVGLCLLVDKTAKLCHPQPYNLPFFLPLHCFPRQQILKCKCNFVWEECIL